MRVLIIEDDKICSDMLQLYLKQTQCSDIEFVTAHSLTQGIEESLGKVFDVMILDLILPESEDPIKTLEKFSGQMKNTPTIVMSGISDASIGMLAIEYGAKEYVNKPNMDGFSHAFSRISPKSTE